MQNLITLALASMVASWTVSLSAVVAQNSPVYPGSVLDFRKGETEALVADFNRDGLMDIVAIVEDEGGALWSHAAFGHGDGRFDLQNPKVLLSGDLGEFATADLNGDDLADLVGFIAGPLGAPPSDVVVALGLGNGDFDLLLSLPLSLAGGFASNLEIADIDGDGVSDVLFSARNAAYVLRGRGNGLFEPEAEVASVPLNTTISALAVGDFDGDDVPDLVLGQELPGSVLILRGLGNASFDLVDQRAVPSPSDLAIADLDDDGDLDIAVASLTPGATTVIPCQGDLTFGALIDAVTTQSASSIVAGDYDNDGVIDLVATNPTASVANVMRGVGGGHFATFKNEKIVGNPRKATPVRINGDLATDWVFTNTSSTPGVVLALGRLDQLSHFPIFDNQGDAAARLTLADMNGDGADDRVFIGSPIGAYVTLWEGDGYGDQIVLAQADDIEDVAIGDFGGDGILDIVLAERDSSVLHIYSGRGDGTFGPPKEADVGHPGQTRGLAAGDVDLDGDDEIVCALENGGADAIHVIDVSPAGTLALLASIGDVNSAGANIELELYDVDHDGALDLFALSSARRLDIRRGVVGSGQFLPVQSIISSANDSAPTDFIVGRLLYEVDDDVDDIVLLRQDGFRAYVGGEQPSGITFGALFMNASFTDELAGTGAVIDREGDGVFEFVIPNLTDSTLLVMRVVSFVSGYDVVERIPVLATELAVGRVNDDAFDDIVTFSNSFGRTVLRQANLPWDALIGATAPVNEALPTLRASGDPSPGSPVRLEYSNGRPSASSILVVGLDTAYVPLQGGFVVPSPDILIPLLFTDGLGDLALDVTWTDFPPGIRLWTQVWQLAGPDTHASNTLTVESR